jgi:hypothetical protein
LLKSCLFIVDDLVRAETEQKIAVFRGSDADHIGAEPARDLHRKAPDASGGALDQYALPRRQMRVIKKGLPDCQGGKRDSGGLRMR